MAEWHLPTTGTTFSNTPDYNNPAGQVESGFYDFDWRPAGGDWAYHWSGTPQVTDMTGSAGQGTANPQSLFGCHIFTRLRTGMTDTAYVYLDPSYGAITEPDGGLEPVYVWYNSAVNAWWEFSGNVASGTTHPHWQSVVFERFTNLNKTAAPGSALVPAGW